ncbi:MAG: hypothetical protein OQL17_00535 [Sedimenticola sp.]|uniref:DUF4410 domain-containing protein n=1 Tax=Sedimenticola thiotaurini TaxID=1543721 RepID=A0A558CUN4_9GAMM|nr:hypothetical protein [Sedimenticola sp.]MCW8945994.1 hypothetical protein [Sedimenticola sp.]MCW8948436.1 hypothetical protein [Sedimenticola sp.]MCW8974233.1 hypothetical protein [Sedimenticola sp.]TVT52456.1 MAG: hypothetical protein FHK82_13490 [Sedimenticola thiotaurini]
MKIGSFACRGIILLSLFIITGCANMYVDDSTKEISASEFKKPDPLRPVQALFEFQTKGVANAQATDYLKAQVLEQIKSSGLFSEVSDGPVTGGALLSITLNNIPITDDAFSKGFVTGFTFGLAGSQVTDGYVCTARYMTDTSSPAIEKKARHAIHTTMGNTTPPENATKAENIEVAITTMTRQIMSNVLHDLSQDSDFK